MNIKGSQSSLNIKYVLKTHKNLKILSYWFHHLISPKIDVFPTSIWRPLNAAPGDICPPQPPPPHDATESRQN